MAEVKAPLFGTTTGESFLRQAGYAATALAGAFFSSADISAAPPQAGAEMLSSSPLNAVSLPRADNRQGREDLQAVPGADLKDFPRALPPAVARHAPQIVIIGGGTRPPEAMGHFVNAGGADDSRIVIVSWATSEPEESFENLRRELSPYQPRSIEHLPSLKGVVENPKAAEKMFRGATAVFFTGGDQNDLMNAIEHPAVRGWFLEYLHSPHIRAIGGTSAGAAIMSDVIIAGEQRARVAYDFEDFLKADVRPGVGLISGVVDQHFSERSRKYRLLRTLKNSGQGMAMGIDEGTAAVVAGGQLVRVIGRRGVTIVSLDEQGNIQTPKVYAAGEIVDLGITFAGGRRGHGAAAISEGTVVISEPQDKD